MDTLNSGGMTPHLGAALDNAVRTLASGGMTPELSSLSNFLHQTAQGAINSAPRGLSNAGLDAQGAAADLVANGGENASTRQAQSTGLSRASRDYILPLARMRADAGEGATDAILRLAEQASAQAARRGGGAGFTVGYGGRNGVLADFADQASRLRAEAQRGATRDWQEAGLRDNAQGTALYGAGANAAANRLATGAGLSGGLENTLADLERSATTRSGQGISLLSLLPEIQRIAAGREGTAFGAIPGTQNAATGLVDAMGRIGLGAMGSENDRIRAGGQLGSDFINQIIQASGAQTGAQGQQNAFDSDLLRLIPAFSGAATQNYQNAYGNSLAGGGLQNSRNGLLAQAYNQGNGNIADIFRTITGNYNAGTSGLLTGGNTYSGYGQNFANIVGQIGRQPQPQNQSPWGPALTGAFSGNNLTNLTNWLRGLGQQPATPPAAGGDR